MPTRTLLPFALLCATGAAPLLHAETIAGFCREGGSLSVIPFTLDTTTGTMQTFPAYTVGVDRAGHYSSSFAGAATTLVTGIQPSGTGTTPEQLVTVDLTSGTIGHAAAAFSNASFTGNSMAANPGVTPPVVYVAQAEASAPVDNPSTNLYAIDVTSGTVTTVTNMPYLATSAWRGSVAHVFFDSANPNFGWVLQPCTLGGVPQELYRVSVHFGANSPYTTYSFDVEFCVDAPAFYSGSRLLALATYADGLQLVLISTTRLTVTPLGSVLQGFQRAPSSPYIGSRASNEYYVLNSAQNLLASWNVSTGAESTLPITVASPCARGSITSFASVY